jgi:hypothetical protein
MSLFVQSHLAVNGNNIGIKPDVETMVFDDLGPDLPVSFR